MINKPSPALYMFLVNQIIPAIKEDIDIDNDNINEMNEKSIAAILKVIINTAVPEGKTPATIDRVLENHANASEYAVEVLQAQQALMVDSSAEGAKTQFEAALSSLADQTNLLATLFILNSKNNLNLDLSSIVNNIPDIEKLRLNSKMVAMYIKSNQEEEEIDLTALEAKLLAQEVHRLAGNCYHYISPTVPFNDEWNEEEREKYFKNENNKELHNLVDKQEEKLFRYSNASLKDQLKDQSTALSDGRLIGCEDLLRTQKLGLEKLLRYSSREIADTLESNVQDSNQLRGNELERATNQGVDWLILTADEQTINRLKEVGDLINSDRKVKLERSQSSLAPLYTFIEFLFKNYQSVKELITGSKKDLSEIETILNTLKDNMISNAEKINLDVSPMVQDLVNLSSENTARHQDKEVVSFVEQLTKSPRTGVARAH